MDVNGITSDLVAMEMELNYHYSEDDVYEYIVDVDDIAITKTPKTSYNTRPLLFHTKSNEMDDIIDEKVYKEKNVSLALKGENFQSPNCSPIKKNNNKANKQGQRQSILKTGETNKSIEERQPSDEKEMISLSALNGFKRCNSMCSVDDIDHNYSFVRDVIVNVTMKASSKSKVKFVVPGHLLITREEEMKCIDQDLYTEWNESLIMQKISKKNDSWSTSLVSQALNRKEISIVLELKSLDDTVVLTSALVKCLENFYKSGVINISDNVSGRDLILILRLLRIVYTQQQVTFDSFGTYLQFKLSHDYFNYRKKIAEWIKEQLICHHSQHRYIYITHPELLRNEAIYFQGQKCEHLDGGLTLSPNNDPKSCTVVHDLFAGNLGDNGPSTHPIREDFLSYLQLKLPGTNITFSLQRVAIETTPLSSSPSNYRIMVRPLLSIEVSQTKSKQYHSLSSVSMMMNNESPSNSHISFPNRLDISSLTGRSHELFTTIEGGSTSRSYDSDNDTPVQSHRTIDSINADWLVGIFFCESSTTDFLLSDNSDE